MGIKSLTKVTRTVLLLLLATVIVCSAAAVPQTGSSADPQVESVIKKLEGVEVDYSSYLNTSIYQPLPSSVRDDEEISVIITLPVVDLMDAYDASAKTMSMTDFALSADAAAITAEIAAQRDQTLALLDNMGVEYTVGEHLKRKLVIIGDVTYSGILNTVLYVIHGCKYRVGEDKSDRSADVRANACKVVLLVNVGRNVSSALVKSDLHIEACAVAYSANMMLGIEYRNVCVSDDIACSNVARTRNVDNDGLGLLAFKLRYYSLNVEHDFRNVFLNTVANAVLVKNSVDLYARCRITGKGGKKDSAKRVTNSNTVASNKGLNDEYCFISALGNVGCGYIKLLYCVHHFEIPPNNL